jgi:hypothetical protein
MGNIQRALVEFGHCEAVVQRLQHPIHLYFVRSAQAGFALLAGRLDQSRALIGSAWECGRPVGRVSDAFHAVQSAILLRECGDLEHLLPRVREIQSAANGLSAQAAAGAIVFSECGRLDDARAEMERLFASGLREQLYDPNWLPWYVMLGRIAAALDTAHHARQFYDLLLPYQEYTGVFGIFCAVTGINQLTLAMLARSLGAFDRALDHAQAALGVARRMNAIPEEARCQLELARIHGLRERPELVTIPLEAARRIAAEIGMKGVLREIAELESKKRA